MGVTRGAKDFFNCGVDDDMHHIIEPISSSDNESITNEPVCPPRRQPMRQKPGPRDTSVHEQINKRRKGQKQARRYDGLKELINMVGNEELEMDFNMFEPSMSAFAELFTEKEKMQVWNDFVNSTEEQQEAILNSDGDSSAQHEDKLAVVTEEDSTWEHVPDIHDKRATHPCYSAEKCFQRIDKNIRVMLKRRHRPMGMLVSLEQTIVEFFKEWPQSVYISHLSNSYERMMLHALCQYLQLTSKSYDSGGSRQTQVENPSAMFVPPSVLLTQYLEQSNPPEQSNQPES